MLTGRSYIVTIRFFRQLVVLQDEFYVKHMAEKQVLGPILDLLLRTLPRDNLLSSACLDLFEFIKGQNIKELNKYLAENHREKLAALSHMETFHGILTRYDQSQGYSNTVDTYFLESEDEAGRQPANPNTRGLMEHLTVDPAQEEYWNTSDDEDDGGNGPEQAHAANGSSPSSKPLVDYASDEESDGNDDASMTAVGPEPDEPKGTRDPSPHRSDPPAATPPPERISEKRRREQDEDDELDKLMQHKRRNSSSASMNSANAANLLRRKKSFVGNGSRDPSPHGPKKISISLSSSIRSAAGHSPPPGNDQA